MEDWQSIAIYNKIGNHQFTVTRHRMSVDDTELERLRTLEPQAITAIHNRYYPEVYRFARYRVGDQVMAEDIASDVFMHLLEAVHLGRGPETNLRGWLIKTTANLVNDHFRKIYHRPKEDPAEVLDNVTDLYLLQSDPVQISDQSDLNRKLRNAIDQLTDAQKLVITLRFGINVSLEETARLMGKTINTVKALQYRALEALRKKLGSENL